MNRAYRSPARGFSLIEVLVAVVILSVGLLALASLQMSLVRSSSESKSQSVAAGLAKETMDSLRAFQDLDGYAAIDSASTSQTIGGITYTIDTTVARYALDSATGDFTPVTGGTTWSEDDLTADTSHSWVLGRDFKTVKVDVSWADVATGTRHVVLDDVIDGLNPSDSARVAKAATTSSPRKVQVIITDPSSEAGVIPIAIGDDTDTAATNPRPEIAGTNNNQRVVETRFDIYTYSALSGGNALAQSRVETVVVGCTCDTTTKDTLNHGYRPTYWNGTRYVAPSQATYYPAAGHASLGNNDPPESDYCDVCCRDHEDPSGVTGAKFDPWRTTHTHYNVVNGSLAEVGVDGETQYLEACRLIRTDGIFRVAADFNDEYMNLLPANNGGTGTSADYSPTDASVTNYQAMVLAYLDAKVVTPSDSSEVPSSSTYNNVQTDDERLALEAANGINYRDTNLEIQRSNDYKWLHARGLYIDYLEKETLQAINEAKTACVTNSCTDAEKQSAVLALMPFTSINVTEIANWTPLSNDNVVVTNNDFLDAASYSTPVRGKATPGSSIPNNPPTPAATATATLRSSNSGLALILDAIDPDESSRYDVQPFSIPNGSSSGTSGTYTVTLSGYTFSSLSSSYPDISPSPSATCNYATTGGSKPNPYTCTSTSVGVATTLTVGHYNYQVNGQSQAAISCSGPAGTVTYTPSGNTKYTTKTCRNYTLSSATLNGSATGVSVGSPSSDGQIAETTTVSFTSLPDSGAVALTFTGPTDTAQALTCTYTQQQVCQGNGNNCSTQNVYTVSASDCP